MRPRGPTSRHREAETARVGAAIGRRRAIGGDLGEAVKHDLARGIGRVGRGRVDAQARAVGGDGLADRPVARAEAEIAGAFEMTGDDAQIGIAGDVARRGAVIEPDRDGAAAQQRRRQHQGEAPAQRHPHAAARRPRGRGRAPFIKC